MEKTIVLTELDALLDTRMGALACIDDSLIAKAIKNKYHERVSDIWSHIDLDVDQSEYAKIYDERGLDVLSLSKPTAMLEAINVMLDAMVKRAIHTPLNGVPELMVNLYPYVFEEQVKESIVNAIMYYIPMDIEVKTTYIPYQDLTPDRIKRDYTAVVLYDFNEWLRLNQKQFENTKIPGVTFVVPALHYGGKVPTKTELLELGKELGVENATSNTTFAATEAALIEFINLIMVDVKNFSFVCPTE